MGGGLLSATLLIAEDRNPSNLSPRKRGLSATSSPRSPVLPVLPETGTPEKAKQQLDDEKDDDTASDAATFEEEEGGQTDDEEKKDSDAVAFAKLIFDTVTHGSSVSNGGASISKSAIRKYFKKAGKGKEDKAFLGIGTGDCSWNQFFTMPGLVEGGGVSLAMFTAAVVRVYPRSAGATTDGV